MKGGIFTLSGLSETLEWSKKLNLSCDLLNLNLNQDRNRHHPRWLRCKLYVDTVRIDQHDSLMAWVTYQGITCALSVGNYLWDTLIIHCLPKFAFCKYVRLANCLSICSNIKSRTTHERFDMSLPNLTQTCILGQCKTLYIFKPIERTGHQHSAWQPNPRHLNPNIMALRYTMCYIPFE